ncbi:hypothetical protein D3C72_2491370 [compost metagenome]
MRIATGRDASDCAFLSYHGGYVGLKRLRVDAWVVPEAATLDGLAMLPETPLAAPAAGGEGVGADPTADDFGALVQIS